MGAVCAKAGSGTGTETVAKAGAEIAETAWAESEVGFALSVALTVLGASTSTCVVLAVSVPAWGV